MAQDGSSYPYPEPAPMAAPWATATNNYGLQETPVSLTCPACDERVLTSIDVQKRSKVKSHFVRHLVPFPFRLLLPKRDPILSVDHFCPLCRHYLGSYRPPSRRRRQRRHH